MPEIDPVLPSFVAAEAGPRKGAIAKDGPDSAPGCFFRVWGLTYQWNKDKCYKKVDQCLTSAWRELIGTELTLWVLYVVEGRCWSP